MRMIALLIPVALVGGYLAYDARQYRAGHRSAVAAVPTPTPTRVVIRDVARAHELQTTEVGFAPRAVAYGSHAVALDETADVGVGADFTVSLAATVSAALAAASVELAEPDASAELAEELLTIVGSVLASVSVSIDGELTVTTGEGAVIRLSADNNGGVIVTTIQK